MCKQLGLPQAYVYMCILAFISHIIRSHNLYNYEFTYESLLPVMAGLLFPSSNNLSITVQTYYGHSKDVVQTGVIDKRRKWLNEQERQKKDGRLVSVCVFTCWDGGSTL